MCSLLQINCCKIMTVGVSSESYSHMFIETNMFFGLAIFLLWTTATAQIEKKKNGWNFISGRGCGTITPIKIFNSEPLDTTGITCAMIRPEGSPGSQVLRDPDLFKGTVLIR